MDVLVDEDGYLLTLLPPELVEDIDLLIPAILDVDEVRELGVEVEG